MRTDRHPIPDLYDQPRWEIGANQPPIGWRGRLARWCRRTADRLDGRTSVALSIVTHPPLPVRETDRAIEAGLRYAGRLIGALVAAESADLALWALRPDLYRSERQRSRRVRS